MNTPLLNTDLSPTATQLPIPHLAHDARFHSDSRLWFFTSDKPLSQQQQEIVEGVLMQFTTSWTAHNQQLKAAAELFAGRIIVLLVDELQAGASGCSIDKSTHLLEQLGTQLGVDFFNRFLFTWADHQGNMHTQDKASCAQAIAEGVISPDTYFLDTLVHTKGQLQLSGWKPYTQSWIRRVI